jgi:class 3 adenylate cyclase
VTATADLRLQATRRTNLGRSRLIVCLPAETSLASKRLDRRLSAILAADVAGYSQLVGADEEGTISQLKAHRALLFDPSSPSMADAW